MKSFPKIFLLIFFSLFFINMECGKRYILEYAYKFQENINVSPYKKIYTINDTITLEFSTTNKTLYDKLSSQRINTDTTYLGLSFQYEKHYPIQYNVVDTVCYTKTEYGINVGLFTTLYGNTLSYQSKCSAANYQIKVQFIPKKVGIYSLNAPFGLVADCPNKLSKFPYSTVDLIFNLIDCNKDIYLSIPAASRGESPAGHTEGKIDRKEMFFFKVE